MFKLFKKISDHKTEIKTTLKLFKKLMIVVLLIPLTGVVVHAEEKAVVTFCFDDAPISVYELGFPVLKRYNIPATVFVATKFIEDKNPTFITWDQIIDLDKNGWGIQCHTSTHPYLTHLTNDQINKELDDSLKFMRDRGFDPVALASPYGDFDDRVLKIVAKKFKSHRAAWNTPEMKGITGLNDQQNLDLMRISAVELRPNITFGEVKDLIDTAVVNKQWLVFFLHGVVHGSPREYQFNVVDLENVANYVAMLRDNKKLYTLRYADVLPK